MDNIRIGTSGYSIDDWKGTAYPANIKPTEMFNWYVNQFRFNTVEINYTYYRQPTQKTFDLLLSKAPDNFDFTVKLFGGISHDPWKDFPPTHIDLDLCNEFLQGIKPIVDASKLGCILAQFPASLMRCPEAWGYLLSLPEALERMPLVFEFRNKSWISQETFELLKAFNIGFCVVDEPQLGALMPLVPKVTSEVAYLRLHGRSKKWFKDPELRYDYLYSKTELESFIPIIKSMSSQSKKMYISFNNCHAGSAVQNVRMLRDLLGFENLPLQGEMF